MATNVNLLAPIGVLAFLGTAFLLVALFGVSAVALFKRKAVLARFSAGAMLIVMVVYFAAMLIFSFASSDKVLARGQEKYFCEIDCHLAYSIADSRESKTIGDGVNQVSANGLFRVVTIKTRFDETTISPRRGDSLLQPNPRSIYLVDDGGKKYFPLSITGTPIETPLRPGESYLTTYAFDLPAGTKKPVLVIRESDPITHLLIGHENSLLHQLTRFQI